MAEVVCYVKIGKEGGSFECEDRETWQTYTFTMVPAERAREFAEVLKKAGSRSELSSTNHAFGLTRST